MPSHTRHTFLNATPQEAFDYLTTPACWREWHVASLGTVPDDRQPQMAGATFVENIRTAGFRRRLQWHVVEARRPHYWEAMASMADGSRVRLRYQFAADGTGTTFSRTLDYSVSPLWLRLVDAVFGRFKIRLESSKALRALQQHFEQSQAAGSAALTGDR